MVIGALPSSGLTNDAPLLAKIVGLVTAALAAYNYTAQRTQLKQAHLVLSHAHLAARAIQAPAPHSKVPQVAASAMAVALVVGLGVSSHAGCSAPAPTSTTAGQTLQSR